MSPGEIHDDPHEGRRFWALALIASYFPDFREWLARTRDRNRYMQTAEEQLEMLPQSALEKACKRLLQAEPVRHSRLPFVVADLARKIAASSEAARWRAVADGRETVACRDCQDTGLVDILHPKTVADCLVSRQLPSFPYTAVALCPCAAGQAKREMWLRADRQHRIEIAFYTPQRHIVRQLGRLPMDQYRELLGQQDEKRDTGINEHPSARLIVAELTERTQPDDF
jgi:hypothetical protein